MDKEDSLLLLKRVCPVFEYFSLSLSLSHLQSSVLYTYPSYFFNPSLRGMSAALQELPLASSELISWITCFLENVWCPDGSKCSSQV